MANSAKFIRDIIKHGQQLGYLIVKTRKNHYKFQHGVTGKIVIVSGTPSCYHAGRNALRDLKRSATTGD